MFGSGLHLASLPSDHFWTKSTRKDRKCWNSDASYLVPHDCLMPRFFTVLYFWASCSRIKCFLPLKHIMHLPKALLRFSLQGIVCVKPTELKVLQRLLSPAPERQSCWRPFCILAANCEKVGWRQQVQGLATLSFGPKGAANSGFRSGVRGTSFLTIFPSKTENQPKPPSSQLYSFTTPKIRNPITHTKETKDKNQNYFFWDTVKRKGPSFLMFARRHCATWIQIWTHPVLGSWVQFVVLLKGSRADFSINEISDNSWECGFGVVKHRSLNLKRRNSNNKMFLLVLWTGNLRKASWLARRAVGSPSAQDRDLAIEAGSAPSWLQKASRLSCPLWA